MSQVDLTWGARTLLEMHHRLGRSPKPREARDAGVYLETAAEKLRDLGLVDARGAVTPAGRAALAVPAGRTQ